MRFSRALIVMTPPPVLRSGATYATPWPMATSGRDDGSGLPATLTSPASRGSEPKAAPSTVSRPEPASPAMPTISPRSAASEMPAAAPAWRSEISNTVSCLRAAARAAFWRRVSLSSASSSSPASSVDDRGMVEVGDRARADHLAVAEHRDLLGDAEHLAEVVGHVQHADARGRDRGDAIEQVVHLVDGQRRGRLVEDEQAVRVLGVFAERTRDGDAGPLRGGEGGDHRLRVDVEVELRQVRLGLRAARPVPDRSPRGGEARAERHVVLDRQGRDEPEVLLHEPAAQPVGLHGRLERQLVALDPDTAARIGRVVSGQDLDQGRLPRPVLTQERMNLAGLDGHADARQRLGARERLRHRVDFEHRGHRVLLGRVTGRRCLGEAPELLELVERVLGLAPVR